MSQVLAPFLLLQVSSPPVPRGSDMRSIGLCAICIFPWREGKFELNPLNVSECDCKNDGFLGKKQENQSSDRCGNMWKHKSFHVCIVLHSMGEVEQFHLAMDWHQSRVTKTWREGGNFKKIAQLNWEHIFLNQFFVFSESSNLDFGEFSPFPLQILAHRYDRYVELKEKQLRYRALEPKRCCHALRRSRTRRDLQRWSSAVHSSFSSCVQEMAVVWHLGVVFLQLLAPLFQFNHEFTGTNHCTTGIYWDLLGPFASHLGRAGCRTSLWSCRLPGSVDSDLWIPQPGLMAHGKLMWPESNKFNKSWFQKMNSSWIMSIMWLWVKFQ